MNIFIDTNVFLSFYHLSTDDLEELKKLAVLVRRGEVVLFLPDQVIDEFQRNRASKINDAMKRLKEQKLALQFPQICRQYEEYEILRTAQSTYEKNHAKLIERIERDVQSKNLDADEVIKELFEVGDVLSSSPEIIEEARLRMELGRPPGKKGSLGDAINWELLLEEVPTSEDLYFISEDSDYYSPLDSSLFDPYLVNEWEEINSSELHAFKRLSTFFADQFPKIELATEIEKDRLIRELANSRKFSQTRSVIGELSKFSDFTRVQVNDIINAAVTNNQIFWIAQEPEVHNFMETIVNGRENTIDLENLPRIRYFLDELEPYKHIPF